jgi:PD-(D/E)XK nuclease superfamily
MLLPLIRSHERIDYKRCPKKWYWKWRKGLVKREIKFGALDLGTWMHSAFQGWYGTGLRRTDAPLVQHFLEAADDAIARAKHAGAPEYVLEKAEELAALGEAMTTAYQKHYGQDPGVEVIRAEIPLEFTIPDASGNVVAVHKLKPDLVYADRQGDIWLMEHKTAAQIRTGHLVIDDQARPYGAMAERALRNLGVIDKHEKFRGITYNFLRKALPDERATDSSGKALNKNGTVSKRQPAPNFVRVPVTLTAKAKVLTLKRVQMESIEIAGVTALLRQKVLKPELLNKTPHGSCEKFCDYFTMCVAEEQGADIRDMQQNMYDVQNPYDYEETTDVPVSFEMG